MKRFLVLLLTGLLAFATPAWATISVAYSALERHNSGDESKISGTITTSSTYTTGGFAISLAQIGLEDISHIEFQPTDGYVFQYDYSANKVLVYRSGGFTPAGSFTGTAVDVAQTVTVTHDGTPDGNPIYLKYGPNGPYLACNMATDTVDKVIAFSDGGKIAIDHDASASSGNGAIQVYFDSDGAGASRLLAVDAGAANIFLPMSDGNVLEILHDASAATNGNAITYDDGADERLESNNTTAANATISSQARTWVPGAPAGSFSGSAVAEAALNEVDNGTSLALTIQYVAYGR